MIKLQFNSHSVIINYYYYTLLMSILYSLISKDLGVVLSEYTEYSGNFQQITRMILKKVHPNTKYTIEYDK